MDFYKAEYIWIDGTEPVSKLRSKAMLSPMGGTSNMGFRRLKHEPGSRD